MYNRGLTLFENILGDINYELSRIITFFKKQDVEVIVSTRVAVSPSANAAESCRGLALSTGNSTNKAGSHPSASLSLAVFHCLHSLCCTHHFLSLGQLSLLLHEQGHHPVLHRSSNDRRLTSTSKSQSQIPGRGNLISPTSGNHVCPEVWAVHSGFIPKTTAWKGLRGLDKRDKYFRSQGIKVNINDDKLC